MKRIMLVLPLLSCISLLVACASSVPMKAESRVSIRSVAIDQQIPLPKTMFYRGPEFTLGAFGVVGSMAEDNIKMRNEEKLSVLMRREQIDVSEIVRDEFISVIKARQVFPLIVSDGGDATISLTIKIYGLAYGFSSKLKPMLGVEGCLTTHDGSIIWKKYTCVTNVSGQTPSYTIGEFMTNP